MNNNNYTSQRKKGRFNNSEQISVTDYNPNEVLFKNININNYPVSKLGLSMDKTTIYPSSFIYFIEDKQISDKLAIHKCSISNSTRAMSFKLSPVIEQLIREHYPDSDNTITEITTAFKALKPGNTLIIQINPSNTYYIQAMLERYYINLILLDVVEKTNSIKIGDRESVIFCFPKSISKVIEPKPTPMPFETPGALRTPGLEDVNHNPFVRFGEPPQFRGYNNSPETANTYGNAPNSNGTRRGNLVYAGRMNNTEWDPAMATPARNPQDTEAQNDPGSPTQPQSATANATTATGGYSRKGKIKRNQKMNKKITRKHRK
jgi:hypothetical protein